MQLLVSSSAVSAYTNVMKESIKKQTEFLTVASPTSSKKVRTDDIFTSLLIQHGRKPVEDLDMERGEQLQQYSRGSGKPVEHSQDIFLSESDRNDDMNPKSVLVTRKAIHRLENHFLKRRNIFCFTHLTLQEYLAARWLVKQREIPSYTENASGMVLQFMSGILSKQSDHAFMRKLLRGLIQRTQSLLSVEPLIMKCLAEYHDKEFALNFVKKFDSRLFNLDKTIEFEEMDCIAVSFLLGVISTLNAEEKNEMNQPTFQKFHSCVVPCAKGTVERSQTSSYHSGRAPAKLYLFDCRITQTGLRQICKLLKNELCTVTSLDFYSCSMGDECVATIAKSLPLTNGVASLCQALQAPECRVTTLSLSNNQISDAGVITLCQALQTPSCQVTKLDLSRNQITDAGVANLFQALQTAACKVTSLYLSYNQITDAGVTTLCRTLKGAQCPVQVLNLSGNSAACKVTELDLSGNQVTDAGVTSLCQALQTPA